MGGTQSEAESTFAIHIRQNVVAQDLHIKREFQRQFIHKQRKLGAVCTWSAGALRSAFLEFQIERGFGQVSAT